MDVYVVKHEIRNSRGIYLSTISVYEDKLTAWEEVGVKMSRLSAHVGIEPIQYGNGVVVINYIKGGIYYNAEWQIIKKEVITNNNNK